MKEGRKVAKKEGSKEGRKEGNGIYMYMYIFILPEVLKGLYLAGKILVDFGWGYCRRTFGVLY